jgi:hypothetical protein
MLKAKEGDSKALEDIIKTYEIFTNIQMKKYGVKDIESCYSEVLWNIYQCVNEYKTIQLNKIRKAA